jgi:hypothetical protein
VHYFGVGQKKHDIGPLSDSDICKIPLVLFIPSDPEEQNVNLDPKADADSPATSATPTLGSSTCGDPKEETSPPLPPLSPVSSRATQTYRRTKRRRLWRLFFPLKRLSKDKSSHASSADSSGPAAIYVPTPYPLHPLPPNQSTCPICLCGMC